MKKNAIAMENSRTLFGRRVRVLRKLRGISQAELARRAGVGQSTISEIENVEGSDIEFSLRKAEPIARVLGYEFWQLILPVSDQLSIDEPDTYGISDFRRAINRLSALISYYSELSEEDQQKVNSLAEELVNQKPDL